MQAYWQNIDETVLIGDQVRVTVLEVEPDCVRLGIFTNGDEGSYFEKTLYLPDESDYESSFQGGY